MTDDIVTRLRVYDFMRDGDIPDVIMNEAADEIERLRKELEIYKDLYASEIVGKFLNE
jgi:hypothetical protein